MKPRELANKIGKLLVLGVPLLLVGCFWNGDETRYLPPGESENMEWGMTEEEWTKVVGKEPSGEQVDIGGHSCKVLLIVGRMAGRRCRIVAVFDEEGLASVVYGHAFGRAEAREEFQDSLLGTLSEKYGPADKDSEDIKLWEEQDVVIGIDEVQWEETRPGLMLFYATPRHAERMPQLKDLEP